MRTMGPARDALAAELAPLICGYGDQAALIRTVESVTGHRIRPQIVSDAAAGRAGATMTALLLAVVRLARGNESGNT